MMYYYPRRSRHLEHPTIKTEELTVIDSKIPVAVIDKVLLPMGVVSAQSVPPGMSGASVFQCQLASGDQFALKRWPDGSARARIEEVHSVIKRSGETCSLIPSVQNLGDPKNGSPQSVFTHAGAHWDSLKWMPGPVAASDASLQQIQDGARAIAQFHASVRCLGVGRQPPPAVHSRLKRIRELDPLIPQVLHWAGKLEPQTPPEIAGVVLDACHLLQWKWKEVRARIHRNLVQYEDQHVHTQYVLRDVHREHILHCDGQISGLIDFDSVRVDTPSTDLARWVGSFLIGRPDAGIVWEAAVAGFRRENTLITGSEMEFDPKMAKDLCFATTWISLANWLVWILREKRAFPAGPKAVVSRLRELIGTASLGI
jgi:Ser/Thr protein kinase RdoA (MazF antagonist)